VELEVELLTGRTHQIRGQLSEAGFPIVGDAQYGGALSVDARMLDRDSSGDDKLALQCCQLDFVDPDIVQKQDGTVDMKRSNRWNRFRLDDAWWTSHLRKYQSDSALLSQGQKTTDTATDTARNVSRTRTDVGCDVAKPHLLPDRVSLSPGRNKYVLVRARHPNDTSAAEEWFVKSAAPGECGGPYHGNVAQDLREWIEAAGYEARVTGGGRIYYRPDENCAIVYGFSYAFGRGDHNRAAEIIRATGIYATVDSSPDLY
jgi:Janus/Ocnus family (Ocnus)